MRGNCRYKDSYVSNIRTINKTYNGNNDNDESINNNDIGQNINNTDNDKSINNNDNYKKYQ